LKLKVFYTVDKRETNNAYEFQHLVVTHSGVRRKLSWGVHSMADGGHLYLVCAVCDVTI